MLSNGKITNSILNSIGNTPLLEMNLEHEHEKWHFFAKLEFMNPTGSIKDRIAKYVIEQAEKRGELKSDSIVVEATNIADLAIDIGLIMIFAQEIFKKKSVSDEKSLSW